MHDLAPVYDPLVLAISGSYVLRSGILDEFSTGSLEVDDAFGPFYGRCCALSPEVFDPDRFEPHEGFWAFDTSKQGSSSGELAWFQVGLSGHRETLIPLPVIFDAGVHAINQVASVSIAQYRVQVPLSSSSTDSVLLHNLLDQFVVVASRKPVTVVASLWLKDPLLGQIGVDAWFSQTHLGPLEIKGISKKTTHIALDNRWSLRKPKHLIEVTLEAPEWSPISASTIALLMVSAAQAACCTSTAILDLTVA